MNVFVSLRAVWATPPPPPPPPPPLHPRQHTTGLKVASKDQHRINEKATLARQKVYEN